MRGQQSLSPWWGGLHAHAVSCSVVFFHVERLSLLGVGGSSFFAVVLEGPGGKERHNEEIVQLRIS